MSNGSHQDNPLQLREALERIFPGKNSCVRRAIALLGSNHSEYRPFHLSSCEEIQSHILAYAQFSASSLYGTEEWDGRLQAMCFRSEVKHEDKASDIPVVFVRALLIGTVDADSQGAMTISSSLHPKGVQIVVAPPPDANLRNTPLWIRDWRYIPGRARRGSAQTEGVFEVLLKDIEFLQEPPAAPEHCLKLDRDVNLDPYKSIVLRAKLNAKSCIIASRSPSACFFAEVMGCSEEESAVTIVFRGPDAVRWWPFLKLGSEYVFAGLSMSVLPSCSRRTVLKAGGKKVKVSNVISGSSTARPCKRARRDDSFTSAPRFAISAGNQVSDQEKRLVTYDGEISRVLADGRFELDGKVTLHLGGFNGSCAGRSVSSICLRKGARVEACWVLAVPRINSRLSLLPTARTIVNILYFGSLAFELAKIGNYDWNETPWRWLWKRWEYSDILWAEDIFDRMIVKFRSWLEDLSGLECTSDEMLSMQVVESLLGSRSATGLVQFIMHIQSGRSDVLKTSSISRRNMYKEFFDVWCSLPSAKPPQYPQIPSFVDVRCTADGIWRTSMNILVRKHEAMRIPLPEDFFQLIVNPLELTRLIPLQNSSSDSFRKTRMQPLGLIGLLQGSCSKETQLEFSDTTWCIPARCVGTLPLAFIGAIVCMKDFRLVMESRRGSPCRSETLVFSPDAVRVVVDGPFIDVEEYEDKADKRMRTELAQREILSSLSQVATHEKARTTRKCSSMADIHSQESLIVDVPLVCIYVQQMCRKEGVFTLFGRLVALCKSRGEDEWKVMDNKNKGFWKCSLTLSGYSALQVTPVFRDNCLFAISCTNLSGKDCVVEYLHNLGRQCAANGKVLTLTTHLETRIPWVENLGNGYYMKFSTGSPTVTRQNRHQYEEGHSLLSSEGAKYAYVTEAVDYFRKEPGSLISQSLSQAYHWGNDSKQVEQQMNIRGLIDVSSDLNCFLDKDERSDIYTITIRDPDLKCFSLVVQFYDAAIVPTGLAPGMLVDFHNVVRVPTHSWGRFVFVGNSETMVRVESWDAAEQERSTCQDCCGYTYRIKDVVSKIPFVFLWELSEQMEIEAGKSREAGIVRYHLVSVRDLKLSLIACEKNCESCVVTDENGGTWTICMSITAVIDDGSCQATLVCRGFESCSYILNLTAKEKNEIKQITRSAKSIHLDENNLIQNAVSHAGENEVQRVKKRIIEAVPRASQRVLTSVMLNRTSTSSGLQSVGQVDEIEMRGFRLGFGKKLHTACLTNAEVLVESIAIVDDPKYQNTPRPERSDTSLSSLNTIRLFMGGDYE